MSGSHLIREPWASCHTCARRAGQLRGNLIARELGSPSGNLALCQRAGVFRDRHSEPLAYCHPEGAKRPKDLAQDELREGARVKPVVKPEFMVYKVENVDKSRLVY